MGREGRQRMKSLYDKDCRYNKDAQDADHEVTAFVNPIFERLIAAGYNPREISHILIGAIMQEEYSRVLDWPHYTKATRWPSDRKGK